MSETKIRTKRRKHHRAMRRVARRRRRRIRRRRARPREADATQILLQLLQQMRRTGLYAKPPVDPYGRGGSVRPLRSSHRVALDEYRQASANPALPVPGPPAEAGPGEPGDRWD